MWHFYLQIISSFYPFSCLNLYYIGICPLPLPSHSSTGQILILLCHSQFYPDLLPSQKYLVFSKLSIVTVLRFTLSLLFYRCLNQDLSCAKETKETDQSKEEKEAYKPRRDIWLLPPTRPVITSKWIFKNKVVQLEAFEKAPVAPLLP